MGRIGIFCASETGDTAEIARLIQQRYLPAGAADVHDVDFVDAAQVDAYDGLIFGTGSMGCGDYPPALEATDGYGYGYGYGCVRSLRDNRPYRSPKWRASQSVMRRLL
jgi:flavodoxin